MSMTITQPAPPESQNDILGAILLALTAQGTGVTAAKTDTLLAMDLIAKGEELDSSLTP